MTTTMTKIHPTAIIDESAKIADDVEIGAYTIIGKDTIIESGCKIAENANIQYAKIDYTMQNGSDCPDRLRKCNAAKFSYKQNKEPCDNHKAPLTHTKVLIYPRDILITSETNTEIS